MDLRRRTNLRFGGEQHVLEVRGDVFEAEADQLPLPARPDEAHDVRVAHGGRQNDLRAEGLRAGGGDLCHRLDGDLPASHSAQEHGAERPRADALLVWVGFGRGKAPTIGAFDERAHTSVGRVETAMQKARRASRDSSRNGRGMIDAESLARNSFGLIARTNERTNDEKDRLP